MFFHFSAITQNYLSIFGNENTTWEQPFCNLDQAEVQQQFSEQEVLLGAQMYRQIGTIIPNGISYDMNGISSNGYAREDLEFGKAWFAGTVESAQGIDTVEYLIMDLSLELGDEFIIYEFGGFENIVYVDSVYFFNGLKHVRTTHQFWSNDDPLTFIEGVGTNYGIGYMHNYLNMCPCLISINKDVNLVYTNFDCQPDIVGTTDLSVESSIIISPNPSSDYITIQTDLLGFTYQITNLKGEEVLKGKSISSSLKLDVSGLDMNWYIICVENNMHKLFLGKD